MPDITMCSGVESTLEWDGDGGYYDRPVEGGQVCPFKDNCYRHKATPTPYRQAYFVSIPFKDGNCDQLWKISLDKPSKGVVE